MPRFPRRPRRLCCSIARLGGTLTEKPQSGLHVWMQKDATQVLVVAVRVVGKMPSDGCPDLPSCEVLNDLVDFYADRASSASLEIEVDMCFLVFVAPRPRKSLPRILGGSAQALHDPALQKNRTCSRWSRYRNRKLPGIVRKLTGKCGARPRGFWKRGTSPQRRRQRGCRGSLLPTFLPLSVCITFDPLDYCPDGAAFCIVCFRKRV